MDLRRKAIEIAFSHYGKPYRWGGNGPDDFDCSGFILDILKKTGVFPPDKDITAHDIMRYYAGHTVKRPYLACLAFYGTTPTHITHVEMIINERAVIGANSGNINMVSVQKFDYRDDLQKICDPYKHFYEMREKYA